MTLYDEVPYPNAPRIQTHPLRLGALVQLHGGDPVPFQSARILEVGCGDGGNIINLALTAPGAAVVGFDLARTPVAAGQAVADALGLKNLSLMALDILDAPDVLGTFDYIIAHGVYAWTPSSVRDALMRLIARSLSPDGVAFISYNALPGCHLRRIIRDLLLQQVGAITDPEAKIRATLELMSAFIEAWSDEDPLQRALKVEARLMLARPPQVFFHDELGDIWEPQYLGDVVAHAEAHGLAYMCDIHPAQDTPDPLVRILPVATPVETEQLKDFAIQRRFRQSLFRQGERGSDSPDWRRLVGLFGATELRVVNVEGSDEHHFETPDGGQISTTDSRLAERLAEMSGAHPNAVPLGALDESLGEAFLQLFISGVVQLQTAPFSSVAAAGPLPNASPLARMQLSTGASDVTTLHHKTIRLSDPVIRRFLGHLDGQHTLDDLAAEMTEPDGGAVGRDEVELALIQAAKFGLLLA